MQFAGQRTDAELNPVGEPLVLTVKLTDDVLPEPEAILVTGITPQETLQTGISEPEFLKQFSQHALQPNTCIVGFNNIRFDDEFMRFTLWRNFYDAYEWQWQDGRGRWDLLDAVRITRALRPDGIVWPTGEDGRPTNRLEELTELNKLEHSNAHDALSDVQATIAVAKLLKNKQPKLFDYLVSKASKKAVLALLDTENPQPIVHTSGMIPGEFLKTTVLLPLFCDNKQPNTVIAYDLRFDPSEFVSLSVNEMRERLFAKQADLGGKNRLPLKGVHANKAPALAPLGTLDAAAQANVKLTLNQIEAHRKALGANRGMVAKLYDAWHGGEERDYSEQDVDAALYGGFLDDHDRAVQSDVVDRNGNFEGFTPDFHDKRLVELFLRYRARNFPKTLTETEHEAWEALRRQKLSPEAYQTLGIKLAQLAEERPSERDQNLLMELQLYAESIYPEPVD